MLNTTIKAVIIWSTYGSYHLARVQALINIGFEVDCISYASMDPKYPFFASSLASIKVINQCDANDINFIFSFIKTFFILVKSNPHIILTCGYERPESFSCILYSKLFSCKSLLLFENQLEDKKRSKIIELIKKYYIRFFDGIICGGSTHIEYLKHLKYPLDRVVTGYDSVDNSRIQSSKIQIHSQIEKSLSPFPFYFLCIARLIHKKNLTTLIQAYTLYKEKITKYEEKWKLVIGGEGFLREDLLSKIFQSDLSNDVYLAGQINTFEDVVNYYSYAKAFILPSNHSEQWGLVVNEAMAAGLPVIVSQQCGCSSDLVHDGVNGFTFDGNSAEDLSEHMLWMHLNQEKLSQMGKASEAIISKFSTSVFASNVKTLYKRLQ